VNVQKLKLWDDASEFDAEKDKARFRQYEDACDRVKAFYKEQHGKRAWLFAYGPPSHSLSFMWQQQKNKPSPSTSRLASTSRANAVPAWVSGEPWKCSTPSWMSPTQM